MNKPAHHILVCSSSRLAGEPNGACTRRDGARVVQYLEEEIADRGIPNVLVTNTGCLKQCEKGPVMVVYPAGDWHTAVDEGLIDSILDTME